MEEITRTSITPRYTDVKYEIKELQEILDERNLDKLIKLALKDPFVRDALPNMMARFRSENPDPNANPLDDYWFRLVIQNWLSNAMDREWILCISNPNIKGECIREKRAINESLPRLPSELRKEIASYTHAGGKRRKKRRTNKRRRATKRTRKSRV